MRHSPEDVLREWFRDPERWWKRGAAFDDHLRATYGDDVEAAIRGDLDDWADSPRGALALVLRFGRFPHRNAILGRESTREEVEFLNQPDSSFY